MTNLLRTGRPVGNGFAVIEDIAAYARGRDMEGLPLPSVTYLTLGTCTSTYCLCGLPKA